MNAPMIGLPAPRFGGTTRRWLRELADDSGRVPLIGRAVRAAYRRRFERANGHARLFSGIYADFAAAARAIPAGLPVGCDNDASASRVAGEWMTIFPSDYPLMFWLGRIAGDRTVVFDWGGNIGLKYFAYRPYLDFGPHVRWIVNDVPAVVRLGTDVAEREGADAIRFTTSLDEIASADVLFAVGALHFIEDPFAVLRAVERLPQHLLLGKVPISDAPAAVTLQHMGTAVCPNHLFNREAFIAELVALGYRLVDEWECPESTCRIPFHKERSIDAYSGFYFTRDAS